MTNFKEIIKNLPHRPGVYRFYSKEGSVLYIGKAKDLKNRVSSYFQEGRPKNERLTLMISQIERIEYTIVNSEKESLILEANLIHNLQPKYNVLLKDDRNYLYVRITNDPIPGIFLNRRKYDPKSHYFGPYTKRAGIWQTLQVIRNIFPYCQERTRQQRPCNYNSIKQCDGICAGLETHEDYAAKIAQIENILNGNIEPVENFIKTKIATAIELQNFELAALWRDRFRILKDTISDQKIILPQPADIDIISLIVQEESTGLQIGSVFVQNIREGKIVNVNNFLLSGTEEEENAEIGEIQTPTEDQNLNKNSHENNIIFMFLQRFLSSYYAQKNEENIQVLINSYYHQLSEKIQEKEV